jgi:RimJ/RimL family protein N-acetyltransferase
MIERHQASRILKRHKKMTPAGFDPAKQTVIGPRIEPVLTLPLEQMKDSRFEPGDGAFIRRASASARPPPAEYTTTRKIAGMVVTFRPILPEDEPLMIAFHKTLSDRSVHFRYFGMLSLRQRTMHERLWRLCSVDWNREVALVADKKDQNGQHHILGVGRLFKNSEIREAEFAILIGDPWQGKGLGRELLRWLVHVGRKEHLRRIVGHILGDNSEMKTMCEKVGLKLHFRDSTGEWLAVMDL